MITTRNTVRGTINVADIITAYQEAFRIPVWKLGLDTIMRLFGMGSILQLADQYYQEVDEDVIREVIRKDLTDLEKYIAEDFDCDDFAFRLMGVFHTDPRTVAIPIFITWVSWTNANGKKVGHAVLSYYKTGNVYIIEPQNDAVFLAIHKLWELMLLCG